MRVILSYLVTCDRGKTKSTPTLSNWDSVGSASSEWSLTKYSHYELSRWRQRDENFRSSILAGSKNRIYLTLVSSSNGIELALFPFASITHPLAHPIGIFVDNLQHSCWFSYLSDIQNYDLPPEKFWRFGFKLKQSWTISLLIWYQIQLWKVSLKFVS